jgi:hypothetical protein
LKEPAATAVSTISAIKNSPPNLTINVLFNAFKKL